MLFRSDGQGGGMCTDWPVVTSRPLVHEASLPGGAASCPGVFRSGRDVSVSCTARENRCAPLRRSLKSGCPAPPATITSRPVWSAVKPGRVVLRGAVHVVSAHQGGWRHPRWVRAPPAWAVWRPDRHVRVPGCVRAPPPGASRLLSLSNPKGCAWSRGFLPKP